MLLHDEADTASSTRLAGFVMTPVTSRTLSYRSRHCILLLALCRFFFRWRDLSCWVQGVEKLRSELFSGAPSAEFRRFRLCRLLLASDLMSSIFLVRG